MQTKFILCTLIAVLALMLAGAAAASSSQQHHTWAETELVLALDKIRAGEYDRALDDLTNLIDARPHFKLAQFVYGQLMVARTGRTPPAELRRQLQGVRLAMIDEARVRWRHRRDTSARHDRVSAAIIRLAPQYEHVLLADLSHNRLYLFANDNGLPHLLGDFYATIGSNGLDKYSAGDMRTPIGIYRITGFHDGAELPDRYGAGAFPLDYPYALDRRDGRTGHGIWLHGVPRTTFARPPRASDGCVAAANDIILWLRDYIDPGQTPIILTHDLQWLSRDQAPARRASAEAALHDWIESWEALDKERYLAHYADDFTTLDGVDREAFAARKRVVNRGKTSIRVAIDQLSIFRYPNMAGQPMLKMPFRQEYSSNNFDWRGRKVQYWRRSDDQWRILLAGSPADAGYRRSRRRSIR